jgi:hypothetical protein
MTLVLFDIYNKKIKEKPIDYSKKGKVWTFCISCKKVKLVEVDSFYYVYGIWPYCKSKECTVNNSRTGLQVFNTKEQAKMFKETYKEMVFK